ncbi:nonsense-mediated mRNA decay factor SMG7-like [Diorhabda sublineata]|uniref:nonsense-mediated mRNA decay factor SMG7-like n=1 Tax=Diorhabda sublineata TaxID=1163346 RepID=UPI0024E0D0EF|nr:nonsense-mediated mRNA decay factor SMG7-like [Diorhabda sublineata]
MKNMGYKAAVQVLKQAEDLKIKVSKKNDWLNNAEAWTDQQKLQTIYHQVLVLDLEYALDKKVEQDLWNIGFKNHISSLQEQARDKKNIHRSDCQALLTWALESASGFYITLLQELCNTFDVDLPFRKRGNVFGQTTPNSDLSGLPQTSSCLYVCQYCLVHLGDIARYRNQRKQAESFYKQAILVSPTSGHPYNQLALLEASQGNKLSTVFYYIRGIAVKHPFPGSATNLSCTLSSAIDKDSPSEKIQTKMTVNEFIQLFLCTHGYFHTGTELKQAELSVKSLNSVMTALVATQSFTRDMLIKMTTINLYALNHIGSDLNKIDELTCDEKKIRELVLELIAGSLCAFLVPVHTLKMDEGLMDYYALPAVKLLLYSINNDPDVLKEKVFTNRLQIWPSLVKLLNNVQQYLKGFNANKYSKVPLPEDKMLEGFLPLCKNFKDFDFKEDMDDAKMERCVRMKRIIKMSLWLTDLDLNGNKLILKNEVDGETVFEPVCIQPDPTNDLLEEMKSFGVADGYYENTAGKSLEKKAGILKPQGSLEKSREEREMLSNATAETPPGNFNPITLKADAAKNKRGKQNVALQSIFKKMEESSKQVKFIVDDTDTDKTVKFDQIQSKPPPPPPASTQNQPFNLPIRTQNFNQTIQSFPMPPPAAQPDYLTALRNMPNMQMNDNNYQYQKKEPGIPPNMGVQIMPPPYQNSFQNNKTVVPPPPLNQKPLGYQQQQQNSFPTAPFQNVSFPPSHPFNTWKREDVPPMPNPNWWQNNQQSQQNNYRTDYQLNYPPSFSNNASTNYIQGMNNKSNNQSNGGDVFGSPWNSYLGNFMSDGNNLTFENSSCQGMSVRQAMLKEATMPGAPVGPPGGVGVARLPNVNQPPPPTQKEPPFVQNQNATPGYSLFNNSWTPNLPGQLRTKSADNNSLSRLPQQSLFSGQGPKSLAQLLEQQSQLSKNDL